MCAAPVGAGYRKPVGLDRGTGGRVVVVGEGPGNAELARGRAFAGASGRRLDQWLVACGAPPDAPRTDVYLTSVIKCVCPAARHYQGMRRRCLPFLERQLALLQPALVITLGRHAYEALRVGPTPYAEAVCTLLDTADHVLFTRGGPHFRLMPWPHPSGMNRWHNESANRARLERSFDLIRPLLAAR